MFCKTKEEYVDKSLYHLRCGYGCTVYGYEDSGKENVLKTNIHGTVDSRRFLKE